MYEDGYLTNHGSDNCLAGGNFAREWNARVFCFGGKTAKPRGIGKGNE